MERALESDPDSDPLPGIHQLFGLHCYLNAVRLTQCLHSASNSWVVAVSVVLVLVMTVVGVMVAAFLLVVVMVLLLVC